MLGRKLICQKDRIQSESYCTDQLLEDVVLMNVDGDESFELGPLYPTEVGGCLGDKLVQLLTEQLLGLRHYLPEVM